jgi:protein required for attachment to host cells
MEFFMVTKVLVANSSEAHFYSTENLRDGDLHFVKSFFHPESRMKVTDIVTDKPGFEQAIGHQASAYEPKHSPKEVEAEHFAIDLVAMLGRTGEIKSGDSLIIIAPSTFYNLFTKHWHHSLANIEHIAKDYTKFTVKELTDKLREHIRLK